MIRHEDGSYVIEPTEAKNPIRIDDGPISGKEALSEGDILTLGDTYLLFTELEEEDRIDAVNEQKIILANERTIS